MSFTSTVPAAVPSLFQSSVPFVRSDALKYSVPLTFVRYEGYEEPEPVTMSFTSTVPAAVPLLFHNSVPFVGSDALKYSMPLTFVRYLEIRRPPSQ